MQIELRFLISWPLNKEMVLNYLGGLSAIQGSLNGEEEGRRVGNRWHREKNLTCHYRFGDGREGRAKHAGGLKRLAREGSSSADTLVLAQ